MRNLKPWKCAVPIPSEMVLPTWVAEKILRGPMLVGSRFTCDPAPTDTDADYLMLTQQGSASQVSFLLQNSGWVLGGSRAGAGEDPQDTFYAFRKGDINLLVLTRSERFDDFVRATFLAKRLNVLDKEDRIALFKAVMHHTEASDLI